MDIKFEVKNLKSSESYILNRLKTLSEEDKILVEEIVKSLGEWCRVEEVASYLKKSPRAIYQRIYNEDLLTRYFGSTIIIYSKSIIFILEKRKR